MARLNGKVALVTGASSGMGRATCIALANEGSKIVCCDLRPEANPEGFEPDLHIPTAELINQKIGAGNAIFQQLDISVAKQLEDTFAAAVTVRESPRVQQTSLILITYFLGIRSDRYRHQLCWVLGTISALRRRGPSFVG